MRKIYSRFLLFSATLFLVIFFSGCGGGGGGGGIDEDEDTQPDQWGTPGTGENGIPIFWTRLGGNALSGAASIVETDIHDGYVVAGYRQADGSRESTGTVAKFSTGGTIVWGREFADSGYAIEFNCIRKTSDGGYIAAGLHRNPYADHFDNGTFLVLRMDADGNALPGWPKMYETTYSWGVTSICESKNGSGAPDGFVFTGAVQNSAHNDIVSFIEKIDLNGVLVWKRAYDPPLMFGTDAAVSVVPDGNQGFIVAGAEGNERLYGMDELSDRIWVDRIGSNGASLPGWPNYYGSGAPSSIKKTPDGGFVLAGTSFSRRSSKYNDALVIMVNAQGDRVWTKTLGLNNAEDVAADIDLCSDGGYVITGRTDSYDATGSNPSSEVFLMKLDSAGVAVWQRIKGRAPDSYEKGSGIVAASDGGFAVSGQASGSLTIAKFDSTGTTIDLGENDYTLNVTGAMGIISSLNAISITGESINAVSQSILMGGFALDTLIKVKDNPTLNNTGGLSISPAPASISTGVDYVITLTDYATTYNGATITVNGFMTVNISSYNGTMTAGGTYTADLTVSGIGVTVTDNESLSTKFEGSLGMHREFTATTLAQRVNNTSGTFAISGDGITITLTTFWNIYSTNLSSGTFNYYTGQEMVYDYTGIPDSLTLNIPPAISGTNPISPSSGNAMITAHDGSNVKMTISSGGNVKIEVDTDADSIIDSIINTTYEKLY